MNNQIDHSPWCENIIIADADYADRVAFNLIVNFERMLERRIPQADLSTWLVCAALDGGAKPVADADGSASGQTTATTQAILLHSKQKARLDNFLPADFESEIDGQAFRDDRLGEFLLSAVAVEDGMVNGDDLFLDIVGTVLTQPEVKRVIIVPNAEDGTLYDDLRETLRRHDAAEGKQVTMLTMEPRQGGRFQQELLGYSLMAALGIRGDEIKAP